MKIEILKWLWTIFSIFKNFQLPKIAFSIVATKTKTIENSEFLMWIPNRISHHNLSNISVTRVSFNRITSKEKTDDSVSILHSSFLILFYGNADHPEYFPPCHVLLFHRRWKATNDDLSSAFFHHEHRTAIHPAAGHLHDNNRDIFLRRWSTRIWESNSCSLAGRSPRPNGESNGENRN